MKKLGIRNFAHLGKMSALALAVAISTVGGSAPNAHAAESCDPFDTSVKTRHGIGGYFMYTSLNTCVTQNQVQRSHMIGADTILTFGSTLKMSSRDALSSDATFKRFRIGEKYGYDYARSRAGNVKINRVFTYDNKNTYSSDSLKCGKKNGVYYEGYTDNNSKTIKGVFTWWLFPVDGSYSGCSSPSNTYDLVVSYSQSNRDADLLLVNTAKRYGMTTYLGLPKPQMDPHVKYVADTSYHHTLGAFTSRVLATWNQRFGKSSAFSGAYQTLETAAFSNAGIWENNLKTYAMQNRIVQYRLPKQKERVIISPYASLSSQSLTAVTSSYRKIVQTGGGTRIILMPQDGVGTGRVGLKRVQSFYAAAKKAGAAEFWANVEAFKPGGTMMKRAVTDKKTLDLQIVYGKQYAPKVMSYNWSYMEKSGLAKSLRGAK